MEAENVLDDRCEWGQHNAPAKEISQTVTQKNKGLITALVSINTIQILRSKESHLPVSMKKNKNLALGPWVKKNWSKVKFFHLEYVEIP